MIVDVHADVDRIVVGVRNIRGSALCTIFLGG